MILKSPPPCILAGCASMTALADGTLVFGNRFSPYVQAPVYGPELGNPALSKTGNTPTNTVLPGTQIYTGAPLLGSNYVAELFAAPGPNQPEESLLALTP